MVSLPNHVIECHTLHHYFPHICHVNFIDKILPSFLSRGKSTPTQVVAASASEEGMEARSTQSMTWMQLGAALPTLISGETSMKVAAVYACMKVVTESIQSVSRNYYDTNTKDDSRHKNTSNPTFKLLDRINPYLSFSDFITTFLKVKWIHGNSIWVIKRDKYLTPISIDYRQPGQVLPYVDRTTNELWYYDYLAGTMLDPMDVLHFKDLTSSTNPYIGESRINAFANTIGKLVASDEMTNQMFTSGLKVGAVGVYPKDSEVPEDALMRIEKHFNKTWSKAEALGQMAFLSGGATITQMKPSMTLTDAQVALMQMMTMEDIFRMWSVPPPKAGHLEKATYNNMEHLDIQYIQAAILPEVTLLEEEWDYKILGAYPKTRLKLELDSLLRADSLTSAQVIKEKIFAGVLTRDEARALDNRNPVPGGHKFMMATNNMSFIDEKGNVEPVPLPKPLPPQDK